ncbi:MAG: PEGA domain-containing protein [Spirochaetales bacterium]|nr:PEGA domain-containing protein [Spirochaetales bacterium]
MKRLVTALFLILIISSLLWCETTDWSCAVAVFSGRLEEENNFLYRQIPLHIYHNISSYEEHILSEEEISHLEDEDQVSDKEMLLEEWESLLDQRDSLLFDEDSDSYKSLTAEIEELRKQYEGEASPELPEEEENTTYQPLSINYLTPGDGGILYSSFDEAREEEPDFIISGSLDDAGDFILIELTGRYSWSEEDISLWAGAGKAGELDRLTLEMTDALKGILLGRDWSALEVSADPLQAQIFLDNRSLGVGAITEETLEPGNYLLEVRHPRHVIYQEEIELMAGERLSRDVVLTPGEEDLISLQTEPPGADVILGSVYRGQTPLVLHRPMIPEKLIISLDGYDTLSSDLGPESPELLSFSLTAGGVDWEEERLLAKDKFYNSLGWFSISVAAPLVSWGITKNYASIGDEKYKDYLNVYYGSMAVSGTLLGVSLTRLVKYIKASEKSIEQR